ncbi:Hypothetical protein, putative [Bodo saltans]|uniref:DNA-directed RNA polymerase III subunit RPC3 n=1 Tax=Bodo saltans TaxID=75058 RepID=A0A0S4JEM0_BODSA|nr:Hypothetical protein, putative [Bodo saltans]|eukprot:CUG88892.1 Hypothetical protein, putative [Bodo saltans]
MSFREHSELLQDVVRDRFGLLHSKLISLLWTYGPLTLHDVALYLRQQTFDVVPPRTSSDVSLASMTATSSKIGGLSSVDDGSIKSAMALLHEHSLVNFTESDKSYRVRLGYGLVHCVQPILLRFLHQQYGDAGSTIVSIVLEYGALPRSTLAHLATQRRPALHEAIHPTTDQLRRDGVLVAVYDAVEESTSHEDLPALKRLRKDDYHSAAASSSLAILALNHSVVLHRVRLEVMTAFLQPRFDDTCFSILKASMAADTAKLGSSSTSTTFPARIDMSNSISLRLIRDQLPHDVPSDAFIAGVTRLSSGANAAFLRGGGATSEEVIRVRYDSIIDQQRMEICEEVIFARYGILGVRVVKLLLKNQAMEDRFLAEEAIATLHQVREILAGLIRDGTVRQQEIPKVLSADRQPKQSVFLWVINKSLLFSTVSAHVAKSIRTARFRLFVEEERLRNKFRDDGVTSSGTDHQNNTNSPHDAKLHQQRLSVEHSVRAMKLSLFGMMQQMMVMELFGTPASA